MRLMCWNVNSLTMRLPRLLAALARHNPDVVCLQETKCTEEKFPHDALRAAGYSAAHCGQKAYNGVAILARESLQGVCWGFAHAELDTQARLIAAEVQGVQVVCAYVPNGSSVDSPKFAYKLQWLDALAAHLQRCFAPHQPLVLCGDLNIAPHAHDVAQPEQWEQTVLCHAAVRARFFALLRWGLHDVFAQHHPQGGVYSWWDYRRLGFAKNNGLRIDHVLASAPLAQRSTGAFVDRDERKGVQPSDHAPLVVDFRG